MGGQEDQLKEEGGPMWDIHLLTVVHSSADSQGSEEEEQEEERAREKGGGSGGK